VKCTRLFAQNAKKSAKYRLSPVKTGRFFAEIAIQRKKTADKTIFSNVQFLVSVVSALKLECASAEVAFVGRSNAGKSSLVNALCGSRVLSKVSKTPGKTRTINVFSVGDGKWIVDLPGYGYAHVSKMEQGSWKGMIESYFSGRPSLHAIYIVIDAYVGATVLDRQMLAWLKSGDIPYRIIVNKIDRITQARIGEQRRCLASELHVKAEHILWVSAKKRTGIEELYSSIEGFLYEKK
jgi:GTP-binding protein